MLFVLTDIFFSSLHGMQERGGEKMFFIKYICIWYSNSKTSGQNIMFHNLIYKTMPSI